MVAPMNRPRQTAASEGRTGRAVRGSWLTAAAVARVTGGEVLDMNLMYTTLRVMPPPSEPGAEPELAAASDQHQLIRVPNNLFFQRPLRTRSPHPGDSKLPFFTRPKA